ncbi:MAG: SH3 domain-containing protein [Anaerolineae bacterium]|nr:SH3 domain-containing protein [Anaerolineae bacterium]
MKAQMARALLFCLLLTACRAGDAAQDIAAAKQQPTYDIVYVTLTPVPTRVPTLVRFPPTATPGSIAAPEGRPITAENCTAALTEHYTAASDQCLAGPTGFFCNGGLPPLVEPASDALSEDALAEAEQIDRLHSRPLSAAKGGGLLWLRLEKDILMDALIVGNLNISNRVSTEIGLARWRSITIESGPAVADCHTLPPVGALVVQGLYGRGARVFINGVATEINGTLIALTQADYTKFIAIEGQVILVAFGQTATLNVGEQLNLRYSPGDWSKPAQLPGQPVLLEYELIEHLPILLFDRPVPIPQPGYAQTQGGVNMRVAPDINSRLLFQVPAGETMSILGASSDREWLHIRFGNGDTGWMSAELLAGRHGPLHKVYDETPEPPQRYGAYGYRAVVDVPRGGNLREAPDTAFRVKRTLPSGMEVRLLARSPYSPWVQVDADGDIGWMALFTLETEAVISSLPIDYDVPLPPRATPTPSFSYGGGHAYPDPAGGY